MRNRRQERRERRKARSSRRKGYEVELLLESGSDTKQRRTQATLLLHERASMRSFSHRLQQKPHSKRHTEHGSMKQSARKVEVGTQVLGDTGARLHQVEALSGVTQSQRLKTPCFVCKSTHDRSWKSVSHSVHLQGRHGKRQRRKAGSIPSKPTWSRS